MKPERPALFLPRRTSSRRRSSTFSGAIPSYRASISVCSRRWVRSSSTRSRSTGRPLATRCGRSATIPRRRATAASASRATTSSRWPSRAYSQVSPARSTSSAGSSVSTRLRSRARRSASSASPWHLLGRNTAVGVGTRRPAVRRAPDGDSLAQPRSCVLPARSRVESRDHHPGAHRPLRRGRHHRLAGAATTQAETQE